MRRDPEAVAAYRQILAEQGGNTAAMSDEQVIETMDRTMTAVLDMGRKMAALFESLRPAVLQAARATTELYATAGGGVPRENRWEQFTDAELDDILVGLYYGAGEGMFDPDSDLWRELDAEGRRRGLSGRWMRYVDGAAPAARALIDSDTPLVGMVDPCPHCAGQGWEPDKPWKGAHRNWMACSACRNPVKLPEPEHEPTKPDWMRQRGGRS